MARYSTALWDTIWDDDPELGTVGNWALQPEPTPEEVEAARAVAPYSEDDDLPTAQALMNSGGLKNSDPLGTAVLLCIASDARLPDYMVGRFGFTVDDQHEWHGNVQGVADGEEPLGSLLWILRRAPLSDYTAKMAEHFCAEALQVLVRAKVINAVRIHAEVNKVLGRLEIYIRCYDEGERTWRHDLYPIQ